MASTIKTRIKQRIDTSTNWASLNPVLLSGEIGIESDTNKMKIGDGSTSWNGLEYVFANFNNTTLALNGSNNASFSSSNTDGTTEYNAMMLMGGTRSFPHLTYLQFLQLYGDLGATAYANFLNGVYPVIYENTIKTFDAGIETATLPIGHYQVELVNRIEITKGEDDYVSTQLWTPHSSPSTLQLKVGQAQDIEITADNTSEYAAEYSLFKFLICTP